MDRFELAGRIISAFESQDEVKRAFLAGSMASGTCDEFSDIDIVIDVSGTDNARYLNRMVEVMEANFDVPFHYHACHRVPDIYVICFFVRETPIFWSIDIECRAEPHCPSLSRDYMRSIRDDTAGLLKGWVKHAMLLLRQDEDALTRIEEYVAPRVRTVDVSTMSAAQMLAALLDEIARRADDRHREFIGECRRVLETRLRL